MTHLDGLAVLGFPVLLGTILKRFMSKLCDVTELLELVTVIAVTATLGIMAGVKISRVHNVNKNRQVADVVWAIRQSRYFVCIAQDAKKTP